MRYADPTKDAFLSNLKRRGWAAASAPSAVWLMTAGDTWSTSAEYESTHAPIMRSCSAMRFHGLLAVQGN